MPYTLTGFPFDLFLGVAIAFIFKPGLNKIIAIAISISLIIPGFFIQSPYNVIFWSPGGAASMVISTFAILYFLTDPGLVKDKPVRAIPDRRTLRSELVKVTSLEDRQQEYVNIVTKVAIAMDNNNSSLLKINTIFFISLFFSLFAVSFSALAYIYISNPDSIKNIFMEFYNSVAVSPGNYDEWFSGLLDLAAFQIFVANIMFALLMVFIIDKILVRRGIRQPAIGNPVFFKLPFFTLWIYILLGAGLYAAIELKAPPVYLMIVKNSFAIFSSLYIFQGLSLVWLYLQVRLLPAGSVIAIILFTSFILPSLSLFIFAGLLILGLVDFWADLRKKALHPNLMSNGV